MCLVLEWRTRFVAIAVALVLSLNNKVVRLSFTPSSLRTEHIYVIFAQANAIALYLDSADDLDTTLYLFELQLIRLSHSNL